MNNSTYPKPIILLLSLSPAAIFHSLQRPKAGVVWWGLSTASSQNRLLKNENPLTNIETRMSFLKPDFSLRPPPTFFDG